MTDSDDELTLSSSALDALKAFYAERDEKARKFAELKAAADAAAEASAAAAKDAKDEADAAARKGLLAMGPVSMAAFTEDWNESQFWYSDETANLLARSLLDGTGPDSLIAVVSTPSVFVALKNICATLPSPPRLLLLEHDNRFGVFDEFVYYDFNLPTKFPASYRGTADRIIIDPPFLSEDCQTKFALTARWLCKPDARVVVCTGERMAPLVTGRLYKAQNVRTTTLDLVHANGLSNEFYCYANFENGDWTWRKDDAEGQAA